MEQLEQIVSILSITMGIGWASGINLYATLLTLGILSHTGHMALPQELQIVADPLVMMAAAVMYMVEFVADKIPGVDTGWDAVHTFIRIPAGAMLAAGAVGDISPAVQLAAAIAGGGMAMTTHATKSGSRVLINTSPEPFSNWIASIGEDIAVVFGLWAAIAHPWLFLALLLAFVLLIIWLLPKLWAAIKAVFRSVGRLFQSAALPATSVPSTSGDLPKQYRENPRNRPD